MHGNENVQKNRFQRNGKQRCISFLWYFLNNEVTDTSKNILATNVKMVRKELKYGSLSAEEVSYQVVVLCFENNKNNLAYVMFFVTQVLKN